MSATETMQKLENIPKRRSTIWQVSNTFNCSIVGTCLPRTHLRRISRKKIFAIDGQSSDYEIHQALANVISDRNLQSRALNKFLDTVHRTAIRRYSFFVTEEEILRQWDEDVKKAEIAGAYWAILTHPATNHDLAMRVYGECHMLSFDYFTDSNKQARKVKDLANRLSSLEKRYATQKEQWQSEKTQFTEKLAQQEYNYDQIHTLEAQNKLLTKTNEALLLKLSQDSVQNEIERLSSELLAKEKKEQQLNQKLKTMNAELKRKDHDIVIFKETIAECNIQFGRMKEQLEEQQEEIRHLEEAMLLEPNHRVMCENCDDSEQLTCLGADLGGKTVLYVGGLHKMIPRYKELVERQGGVFLHHDGGKEKSQHVLTHMLGCADAVFCPIDCNSHDACKRVKKVCKKNSKPFVMMRSSGLSSFAKGIKAIIQ